MILHPRILFRAYQEGSEGPRISFWSCETVAEIENALTSGGVPVRARTQRKNLAKQRRKKNLEKIPNCDETPVQATKNRQDLGEKEFFRG